MKRMFTLLLTFCLIFSFQTVTVANSVTINDIEQLLRDGGTPEDVISKMDNELKWFIYENSGSRSELTYVEINIENDLNPLSGYTIPASDLKIEVYAFAVGSSQVDIYPLYEWLTPAQPKGKDFFGYSTSSDYSVVPGQRSNLIWARADTAHDWQNQGAAPYTGSHMTGYEHLGLGTPDYPIYIKGNFFFRVDIDDTNPVNKIGMSYAHDTTSGGLLSFSISFGPINVVITPFATGDVGYSSNVYDLIY